MTSENEPLDESEPLKLWQRQSYETDAAFNAFHEYYLVQFHPRSVDEAWRGYRGLSKGDKKRPALSFRCWSQGVNKDGAPIEGALSWQERARAYDDHLAELRLREFEARHMGPEEALALLSDQARGNLADFADVQIFADLKNHPKAYLLKTLNTDTFEDSKGRIHHKMRIEPHDAQAALRDILRIHGRFAEHIEHTGPGGGPIEFTQVEVQLERNKPVED